MPRKIEMRYITFDRSCPEAIRIEIADRVAQSINPEGDPADDRLLLQMLLQLDASNDGIYDRPALNAAIERLNPLLDWKPAPE
jgi:hypothetical protein